VHIHTHNNTNISIDSSNNLIIDYIAHVKNTTNLFDLLINEYLRLNNEDNINEIVNSPKPLIQLNLNKELNNFYQEFDIKFHNYNITIAVYYNCNDDNFQIAIRANNNYINMTMMSVVYFQEDKLRRQVNIKTLEKPTFNIFRIDGFKQNYVNNFKTKSLSLILHLRVCHVHSAIFHYIIKKFPKIYSSENVNKLSRHLLMIIFKNLGSINNSNNINSNNSSRNDITKYMFFALNNWCKLFIFIKFFIFLFFF
jgi:hypothetical protein